MSQIEEDMATLIGLVRELPTREELAACEARILARMSSFGTTVGGDMGGVLQRLEAAESAIEVLKRDARQNQPRRFAKVR